MKLHIAVLLATLALAAAAVSNNDQAEFEAFQKKFGKVHRQMLSSSLTFLMLVILLKHISTP